MWTPKGAALIRGRRLFEARRLLEEIWFGLVGSVTTWYGRGSQFKEVCDTTPSWKKVKKSHEFTITVTVF